MLRRCAMVLGVVSFVAFGIGSVSAETFYQVNFSSQANYSWPGSGALPGAPTGAVTLGGTPFNITSNGAGEQAWNSAIADNNGNDPESIIINTNVYGATNVYTLINTWYGMFGPTSYAWLNFTGSDGAYYTKYLVGNVDIRGYETIDDEGPSSINGTTTINVFNCPSDNFGRPGRLDMQNIALPSAFATQTLTTIELVDNGGYNIQRAILDGVTVGVPEPSTFVLLGSGAVVLAAYPWRRRKRPA